MLLCIASWSRPWTPQCKWDQIDPPWTLAIEHYRNGTKYFPLAYEVERKLVNHCSWINKFWVCRLVSSNIYQNLLWYSLSPNKYDELYHGKSVGCLYDVPYTLFTNPLIYEHAYYELDIWTINSYRACRSIVIINSANNEINLGFCSQHLTAKCLTRCQTHVNGRVPDFILHPWGDICNALYLKFIIDDTPTPL